MSDAERLAERLEALLAKATPPVWIADGKDIVHADGPQAWGKKEVANVALIVEAVNALPTLLARMAAIEEALRPFAGMRKSTEPEVSDLLNRSPSEQLRRQAELTERRDREIDNARLALGKGSE
jgi:hypothetical protein